LAITCVSSLENTCAASLLIALAIAEVAGSIEQVFAYSSQSTTNMRIKDWLHSGQVDTLRSR
jgi:hypothetical protein